MKKSVIIGFYVVFWLLSWIFFYMPLRFYTVIIPVFEEGSTSTFKAIQADKFTVAVGALIIVAFFAILLYTVNFITKKILVARSKKRKFWITLLCAFLLSYWMLLPKSVSSALSIRLEMLIGEFQFHRFPFFFAMTFYVFYAVIGIVLAFINDWFRKKMTHEKLLQENLRTELELLKSQINPHFLFNTLNNIDILIESEPFKASEYLKKLSEILRFMLYETKSESVALKKEIEYISKYIELQKIRTDNAKYVDFEIEGNIEKQIIAPMVFIPFIENAFKYSSNKKIENAITIKFDIESKKISFYCKNYFEHFGNVSSDENGLGNKLIKQRLDLLYKNNHTLHIKAVENWYIVDLTIQINDH